MDWRAGERCGWRPRRYITKSRPAPHGTSWSASSCRCCSVGRSPTHKISRRWSSTSAAITWQKPEWKRRCGICTASSVRSLWRRRWGGTRPAIEAGVSLGIEPSVDALLARITDFLRRWYLRIKIKIKPGWDVQVVREVRRAFGAIRLQVDANSAFTLEQADVFRAMDEYDLLLIEQPLGEDDIVDHAALQAQLRTPICLDESIVSPDDARKAIQLGSCRVINIKAARLSGLSAALATPHLRQQPGLPVWWG